MWHWGNFCSTVVQYTALTGCFMHVKDSSSYTRRKVHKHINCWINCHYDITLLCCFIHRLLVPSREYLETSPVARQSIVLHPLRSHNIKYSGIISAGQIHSHQGNLSRSEIMTWQQRVHIRQGQVQEIFETLTKDKHACTEQFLSWKANSFLTGKKIPRTS